MHTVSHLNDGEYAALVNGMIVAISDIHLGYEKCNKRLFQRFIEEFLEQENIEQLGLLGDIVDF